MKNKSSMLYWYPKIKDLSIPQPRTFMIEVDESELFPLLDFDVKLLDEFKKSDTFRKVKDVVKEIGVPFFLRTDMASGKHDWKTSCFVNSDKDEDIISHLLRVYEFNKIADIMGLPVKAIIIREYIPMDNLFTAFSGEMPVNPEIRFFIRDGVILCWHWYWIEEAIYNPSVENWKEIMENEKIATMGSEIFNLNCEVRKVANIFMEGYWSIDFCKGKNSVWYLIDMAEGEKSWHEEGCKYKQTDIKEGN